jgi:hypothetical protein
MVFGIFAALSEFERELISERTKAGLASARARGRKGGAPFKMTPAKVRLALGTMGQPKTKVAAVTQHFLDAPKAALAADNPILGTWKLQSLVYETIATGKRSNPFGDHPDGYLGYSRDGRMYAILVAEDRPKSDPVLLTDQEKVKLLESMSAYAGTYTADGERWFIVHCVDTSWNGSWTGTDQVRFYKLDGDTLTITTAPLTAFSGEEVKVVLVWKKVH